MDFIFNKGRRDKYKELPTVHENTTEEQLVVKSGFISLKDRISSLSERSKSLSQSSNQPKRTSANQQTGLRHAPQYATLQELFASKGGDSLSNYNTNRRDLIPDKRPKIPIMRLKKEDWNVKCWEDRLDRRHQMSQSSSNHQKGSGGECMKRGQKPEIQVEVFQGRIEDVAGKLEKVREGAPLDEELYRISTDKVRVKGRSHEWTDLLKQELERGAHNPKQLRKEIMSSTAITTPRSTKSVSSPESSTSAKRSRRAVVRSPFGRPIGRILDANSSDSSSSSSSESDSNSNSDPDLDLEFSSSKLANDLRQNEMAHPNKGPAASRS